MSRRTCQMINNFALNVAGSLVEDDVFSLCCSEGLSRIPRVGFKATAKDTLENFVQMRYKLIENIAINDSAEPYDCHKCANYLPYDRVTDNLTRYAKINPSRAVMSLKYIILPNVNDSDEDFFAAVALCRKLNVRHLTMARDIRKKYDSDEESRAALMNSAARLLVQIHLGGLSADMFTFAPKEREMVLNLAAEFLAKARG